MAAKNKSKGRSVPTPIPDIREVFKVHLHASQRRDELLEEAKELQAAGKIREARRVFKHAEQLHNQLLALEAECKRRSPSAREG